MIIKKYPVGDDPDFELDIHIVSKFLYADCDDMYFLVDATSGLQKRKFYLRVVRDLDRRTDPELETVTSKMTYLTAIEETDAVYFLFWDR